MSPTAGIIVIGNEILSGRTQDTNVNWIAIKLTQIGVRLKEARVIPDDEQTIVDTVNHFRKTYDYVFTTGGIGPTHDDITADSIGKAFGVEVKVHDEAFRILEQHYGIEELTPPRAKMARIPVGGSLILNPVSAAPGFKIENVYVMAGVPRIMQAMLDNILPTLAGGDPILSNSISCSVPESAVAEALGEIQNAHPEVDIGSYPHFRAGVLGLSIVVRTTDKKALQIVSDKVMDLVRDLGDQPYGMTFNFDEM